MQLETDDLHGRKALCKVSEPSFTNFFFSDSIFLEDLNRTDFSLRTDDPKENKTLSLENFSILLTGTQH